jgi:hypothetical protein
MTYPDLTDPSRTPARPPTPLRCRLLNDSGSTCITGDDALQVARFIKSHLAVDRIAALLHDSPVIPAPALHPGPTARRREGGRVEGGRPSHWGHLVWGGGREGGGGGRKGGAGQRHSDPQQTSRVRRRRGGTGRDGERERERERCWVRGQRVQSECEKLERSLVLARKLAAVGQHHSVCPALVLMGARC